MAKQKQKKSNPLTREIMQLRKNLRSLYRAVTFCPLECDKEPVRVKGEGPMSGWILHYEEEGDDNNFWSKIWLTAAIVFAALVLISLLHILTGMPYIAYLWVKAGMLAEPGMITHLLFAHMSLTLVLAILALWCGKNYRVIKGMEYSNRHRRGCLRGVSDMIDDPDSHAIRDAILLEAMKSAFAPISSGYSTVNDASKEVVNILPTLTKGT